MARHGRCHRGHAELHLSVTDLSEPYVVLDIVQQVIGQVTAAYVGYEPVPPCLSACRETCRELAYRHNLITFEPDHAETTRRLAMAAMVANHLLLFVGGKMEVESLGEFCCSSRPLHANVP